VYFIASTIISDGKRSVFVINAERTNFRRDASPLKTSEKHDSSYRISRYEDNSSIRWGGGGGATVVAKSSLPKQGPFKLVSVSVVCKAIIEVQ
jgi:hypothetical protein